MSVACHTWREPSFTGRIGCARRDVTPDLGIYARNWGAAAADRAEGVHRRLLCTALSLRASEHQPPVLLVSLDASWFRDPQSSRLINQTVCNALDLPMERLMIALTHTHAGPSLSLSEEAKPGGDLIRAYVGAVCDAVAASAREAMAAEAPAVLAIGRGRCTLAANRDMPDPDADRLICGFHPGHVADETLLVGRVTREEDGRVIATLVNYACHPTTLGWQNTLISPDYVGAMRETVEAATGGAPCLFLQGASGELAPRQQYTADPAVADQHGRCLGYAALSTLEAMLKPNAELRFEGTVESGAPLAVWQARAAEPRRGDAVEMIAVDLPLKPNLPRAQDILDVLQKTSDRTQRERLHRQLNVVATVGEGETASRSAWLWRLGDIVLVGHSDEAYSQLQTALREQVPELAVVVMNVVNGWGGYLYPADKARLNLYQVWQSPYAGGALEVLIDKCVQAIDGLVSDAKEGPTTCPVEVDREAV